MPSTSSLHSKQSLSLKAKPLWRNQEKCQPKRWSWNSLKILSIDGTSENWKRMPNETQDLSTLRNLNARSPTNLRQVTINSKTCNQEKRPCSKNNRSTKRTSWSSNNASSFFTSLNSSSNKQGINQNQNQLLKPKSKSTSPSQRTPSSSTRTRSDSLSTCN